jgi:hypothetical protein
VRRAINLIFALALIVVGAYWFVDLPLYAFHPEGIIVVALGAAMATFPWALSSDPRPRE